MIAPPLRFLSLQPSPRAGEPLSRHPPFQKTTCKQQRPSAVPSHQPLATPPVRSPQITISPVGEALKNDPSVPLHLPLFHSPFTGKLRSVVSVMVKHVASDDDNIMVRIYLVKVFILRIFSERFILRRLECYY